MTCIRCEIVRYQCDGREVFLALAAGQNVEGAGVVQHLLLRVRGVVHGEYVAGRSSG